MHIFYQLADSFTKNKKSYLVYRELTHFKIKNYFITELIYMLYSYTYSLQLI